MVPVIEAFKLEGNYTLTFLNSEGLVSTVEITGG